MADAVTGSGSGDHGLTAAAAPVLRVCAHCRNMRQRQEPQLFSTADLQTPGILKAQVEWEQQRRQRGQQEQQRLAAGIPFDYEPHSFAWCAAYTRLDLVEKANAGDAQALADLMAAAAGTINPVTGKITAIYALCAQKNPEANCPKFESSDAS